MINGPLQYMSSNLSSLRDRRVLFYYSLHPQCPSEILGDVDLYVTQ